MMNNKQHPFSAFLSTLSSSFISVSTSDHGDGDREDIRPNKDLPSSSSSPQQQQPPKPYSLWFHPFLSWTDLFLTLVLGFLMDFTKLVNMSPTSDDAISEVNDQRRSLTKFENPVIRKEIKSWREALSSDDDQNENIEIVECVCRIPVQHDILSKWKILTKDEEQSIATPWKNSTTTMSSSWGRDTVKVLVRFPSTLLSEDQSEYYMKKNIRSESGCILLSSVDDGGGGDDNNFKFDLKAFLSSSLVKHNTNEVNVQVPVLVQFHGGGLTICEANKSVLVKEAVQLTLSNRRRQQQQQIEQQQKSQAQSVVNSNMLTVSVDYGMAPDEPWPVGIIDTLSVLDYLLSDGGGDDEDVDDDDDDNKRSHKTNSTTTLHLSGESAGAHFVLVGGFEACRRYPGQIKSIQMQSPMIDPQGSTMSYYKNQNVFPSTKWLRWCWRSYLGIDTSADDDMLPNNQSLAAATTTTDVLRDGSNYTSWTEWKETNGAKKARLVYPINDIPNFEGEKSSSSSLPSPEFLITTNKGDPLHDEGLHLINELKDAGANVHSFDMNGLHCSLGDPASKAMKERYDTWSEVIFSVGPK